MRYPNGLVDEQLWRRGVASWAVAAIACLLIFSLDKVGWMRWPRVTIERSGTIIHQPVLKLQTLIKRPFLWLQRNQEFLVRVADLEARLAITAVDTAKLQELETKLAQMESMYQVLPSGTRANQLAKIFALRDKIMIGAGEINNLSSRQLVTDQHGVFVGRVEAVGRYVSRVSTPKDSGFKLAAQTQSGGAKGVLENTGSQVVLTGVLQTEVLTVGDVIVTSGIDEAAPPNIVIGQVVRLVGDPADPTKGAEIELLATYEGWAAIW